MRGFFIASIPEKNWIIPVRYVECVLGEKDRKSLSKPVLAEKSLRNKTDKVQPSVHERSSTVSSRK